MYRNNRGSIELSLVLGALFVPFMYLVMLFVIHVATHTALLLGAK